jgi:predicted SpoU family rRNA methylase
VLVSTTTLQRVHNDLVSQTRKDSNQTANTVLEVVKTDSGTFDLFLNGKLDRERIPEKWLNEELCVRFGFCGEEYESILDELTKAGRKRLVF